MPAGRARSGGPFRRRVFYIPGYDPFHPRRYRELYRKEGTAQAALSGYDLTLSPGQGGDHYGWHVAGWMAARETVAEVEVMVWSDIVQGSMSHGIAATYWQLVRTVWAYVGSGAIFRLARLRKGPTIAALYPVVLLLVQLALAGAAFLSVRYLSGWMMTSAVAALDGPSPVDALFSQRAWLALALGLAAGIATLRWFRGRDTWFYAYYLMHDYAFTAQHGGANPAALDVRMRTFGDRIAAALREDWDEVLVVGHSSGAHLGVMVLADLIRAGRVPKDGPALGFLSLGHVVPMVSFLPNAGRLRRDLRYLSARKELAWVDVTAPGDGCAYALCDPVSVTGVAPPDKCWPLVISAAFTQTLTPERWRALRWRFFRLHFQYLCAFDRPGDYDYFQITAGPLTLSDRFAGRPPSKSRIETPMNRNRSLA
jgi:hypothetical protein